MIVKASVLIVAVLRAEHVLAKTVVISRLVKFRRSLSTFLFELGLLEDGQRTVHYNLIVNLVINLIIIINYNSESLKHIVDNLKKTP